jgi:hypothetical protein
MLDCDSYVKKGRQFWYLNNQNKYMEISFEVWKEYAVYIIQMLLNEYDMKFAQFAIRRMNKET